MTESCPHCDVSGPLGYRFCPGCGRPRAGSGPIEHGVPITQHADRQGDTEIERRLVTVLFADLVGSTALGELLDPEEMQEVVGTVQTALAQAVTRYGGYVVKYLGDGLIALFGAPVAREEDAERAVLAGLAMQAACARTPLLPSWSIAAERGRGIGGGAPVKLRVGITTGEVIAGPMAAGYDVSGDAANTAARLQGAGEAGDVLVSEETMRLARRRLRFGERRVLSLKGKAQPVVAYPALGPRDRFAERWELRDETAPLIGRARELAWVLDAWDSARARRGQMVTLVGEAGVGKSRLLMEALRRIGAAGPVRVAQGACLSYSPSSSLWLIAAVLRDVCGVTHTDSPERARAYAAACVEALLHKLDAPTRQAATATVALALGLPVDEDVSPPVELAATRLPLAHCLGVLCAALCEQAPMVLVLENLHWLDPDSADVLSQALRDVPRLPLLVLATQRPETLLPWDAWIWPRRIEVRPLDTMEATALVRAVLRGAPIATTLERDLIERSGGNPFFIEELVAALMEAGSLTQQGNRWQLTPAVTARLPSTLTEVLLARLDRLERHTRGLAQTASVIGRDFDAPLLARVAGQPEEVVSTALVALESAGIVVPAERHATGYVFSHATMREAAYGTLLVRRRRKLHAAIARTILSLPQVQRVQEDNDAEVTGYWAGSGEEYLDIVAYHFTRSQEHTEAVTWLERAGDRAARIGAHEVALGHYQDARAHLQVWGATPTEMRGGAPRADVEQGQGEGEGHDETWPRAARARLDEKIARVRLSINAVAEALDDPPDETTNRIGEPG